MNNKLKLNNNIKNIIRLYLLPNINKIKLQRLYYLSEIREKTYNIWTYLTYELVDKYSKIKYDEYWYFI